jgi:hypothetical protein
MPKPIKSPSNVNAATKGIAASAVVVAVEVAAEIAKLVIEAIANDDPATLKKVQDILPRGHKLRSEITYAVEMEKLRKKLEAELAKK